MIEEISRNNVGTGRSVQQKAAAARETRRFIGFVATSEDDAVQPRGRVFSAAGVIPAFCLFIMRPGYLTLSSPLLQPARPPTVRAQANNTTQHHVSATQKRIQKTTPMKRLTSERLLLCSGPGPPSGSAPVLTEQNVVRHSSVCETERGDTVLTLPRHNTERRRRRRQQQQRHKGEQVFSELLAMSLSRRPM